MTCSFARTPNVCLDDFRLPLRASVAEFVASNRKDPRRDLTIVVVSSPAAFSCCRKTIRLRGDNPRCAFCVYSRRQQNAEKQPSLGWNRVQRQLHELHLPAALRAKWLGMTAVIPLTTMFLSDHGMTSATSTCLEPDPILALILRDRIPGPAIFTVAAR